MNPLKEILTKIKPNRPSEQEQDLVNGLLSNIWKTDKDIINHYWPNNTNGQTYLNGLKGRLTGKLVSSILFYKAETTYQAAYIDCWREYAAIQVLKGVGIKKGAIWMAERLLKKAIYYDLTEIIVSISDMLEGNAGIMTGDRNKWNKFKEINQSYETIYKAEKDAKRKFIEISVNFTHKKSIDEDLAKLARQYSTELSKGLTHIKSFRYGLYTFNLMIVTAEVEQDYKKLLDTCDKALEFFASKPYPVPRSATFAFSFKTIPATLQFKDYQKTYQAIQNSKKVVQRNSYNYGLCLIYQAILGFHSTNDDLVIDAIKESKVHRKYAPIAEQWRIIEAYSAFIDIKQDKPFRLARFLNDVPIYSKDKRGNNITILIIQILFYLKQGKKGKIIDRVEALKLYTKRYLRKDSTYRSNCFIHMLTSMVKGNFHQAATLRYAKPFIDRLGEYQGGEVEIIRYERLWEEVIKLL